MEEYVEFRRGSEGQSVVRRNLVYFDGMFLRNSVQNRDRRVLDLNGSLYDFDEERILYSLCFDFDYVVFEFYMEEQVMLLVGSWCCYYCCFNLLI